MSTSKIQNELVAATDYAWSTALSDADNRVELVKAADRLSDPEWERLSQEAQAYATAVGKACKAAKPIPAPPDLVKAKKVDADEAPAPKAKAKAKAVEEDEGPAPAPKAKAKKVDADEAPAPKAKAKAKAVEEDEGPAPAPKAKAKAVEEDEGPAPAPKAKAKAVEEDEGPAPAPKAKAKKVEVEDEDPAPAPKAKAKKVEVEDEEDDGNPKRGQTVYMFRKVTLLNPTWKKSEVSDECARLGFPVTKSTASLLWYGTRHTRKVMEDLNLI